MATYKKWTDALKETIVKEYLAGARMSDVTVRYDVNPSQIKRWTMKWRESGCFPDNRGKGSSGRPRTIKREDMTDNEYIEYLEMQLEIKKYMAFYEKRKQK
jgi:transposase-like protein